MKHILISTVALLLVIQVIGCGGGTTTPPPPSTGTVSGTVYAPNGTDPVSGALVYAADRTGGATGPPPTEAYEAYDYTDPDGTFDLLEVDTGIVTIIIIKGAFSNEFQFDVQGGTNALDSTLTTFPVDQVEEMAVVTGMYDNIENVLAKLGLGDLDVVGSLVIGTEEFTLVDGNSTLDAAYMDFMDFMGDPANYADIRTIFINCGNSYEFEFFNHATAADDLKTWIEAGGRLYATDQAYDFVEQLFPENIDFYGMDPGLVAPPETMDAAQMGDDFNSTDATILDAGMLAWLQALGVTNADDTVTIEGWLSSWVPIDDIGAAVTAWVEAPVEVDLGTSTRDVTLTFNPSSGTVFYSSYHTEEGLSADLTPQDRILQYLIFEVL